MRPAQRITLGAALAVPVVLIIGIVAWGLALSPTYTAAGMVQIRATPEQLYDLVGDPSRHGEWQAGVQVRDIGRDGAPTQRFQVDGQDAHVLDVVEAKPPHRFVTEIVRGDTVAGTETWTFEPLASTTRVILVHDAQVPSLVPRIFHALVQPQEAAVHARLEALKAVFEHGDR